MLDLSRGVVAGFVATLFISMLMVLRIAADLMTWFDPIEVMTLSAETILGVSGGEMLGWAVHFFVGSVIWGILYALLHVRLPGATPVQQGMTFGAIAWLVVMVTVFPLAGSGFFALGFGGTVMFTTLLAHLIFGAILGWCYSWLKSL